jgi:hypothetical protein
VFWVISVYFNIRNTLPKFFTFLPGHPVYIIEKNEIGGACRAYGGGERRLQVFRGETLRKETTGETQE